MDFTIMGDTDFFPDLDTLLRDMCPYCLGSGKMWAMQLCMTYDAGTVRGPDTTVTCSACKGTGRRRED